jgi:tetratricopeptide (TPR) repeat protein
MKKKLFFIFFILLVPFYQSMILAQDEQMNAAAQKYMNRAEMALEMVKEPGDWQKVIDELNKALTEAPNHPIIIYNLGLSYEGMGVLDANNYKRSIEYYRQFLALNPSEEDRKDVDSKINRAEYAYEEALKEQEEIKAQEEAQFSIDKLIGTWRVFRSTGIAEKSYCDLIFYVKEGFLNVRFNGQGNATEKQERVFVNDNQFDFSRVEKSVKIDVNDEISFHVFHMLITSRLDNRGLRRIQSVSWGYKLFWDNGILKGERENYKSLLVDITSPGYSSHTTALREGDAAVAYDNSGDIVNVFLKKISN